LHEEHEGGLLLTIDYINKDFVFSWVLSFGDKAKVIEPQEAVEEFAEMAKKLFELYERTRHTVVVFGVI
jgi:predicted DNA-binding transcriptional regulator YafY